MPQHFRNIAAITVILPILFMGDALAKKMTPGWPDRLVIAAEANKNDTEVYQDLAALRGATAHLQQFENAAAAGWNISVTDCKENPPIGGMGFHYGNLAFYLDGEAKLLEPEVLLYEPQPNGRLRLVGVEYLVPAFAWQESHPPRLFGRDFQLDSHGADWALHVWVWKHNPEGTFQDWNPEVNCDFAG